MRVLVLHNAIDQESGAEDRDVLVQVQAVCEALHQLRHEHIIVPCTLDLACLKHTLRTLRPDRVFNLVESLDGSDRLITLVPLLLESLRIPYTGVSAEGLMLSSNKVLTKERLRQQGLPTPAWVTRPPARSLREMPPLAPPYILKAIWEHASFALDDSSVIQHDPVGVSVYDRLANWEQRWQRPCFAEQFIAGREFNLSLLGRKPATPTTSPALAPSLPQVLPPAEILFGAFPADKPHVVGYRAKWDEQSFEYHHTPRTFDFPASDQPLLDDLMALARDCWHLFGLRGHARVDFRVDAQGRPWILEINANPCLSPDAGFAAALQRAGLPFHEAIRRILADCSFLG